MREDARPWFILGVVSSGAFLTMIDLNILNVAIPTIVANFASSGSDAFWILNSYSLVYAALLISAGRIGDTFGHRNVFAVGLAIFGFASLICGISPNLFTLIGARAVQGAGAALVLPQGVAIIMSTFSTDRHGAALGIWSAAGGLAGVAAPTVGGYLVSCVGWRWIFFVNVPIAAIALVFTLKAMDRPARMSARSLDLFGAMIGAFGLFLISFGIIDGQRFRWNGFIATSLVGGLALAILFLIFERARQSRGPLVPFGLFKNRNYVLMVFTAGMVSIGMIGLSLPLMIFLQSIMGMTAFASGLFVAPSLVIAVLVAPFAGRLSDRFGGKYVVTMGLVGYALGICVIGISVNGDGSYHLLMPGLIMSGFGTGFTFAPLTVIAMGDIDAAAAGIASGVLNTARQVGFAVANAAVASIFASAYDLPDTKGSAFHAAILESTRVSLLVGLIATVLAVGACCAVRGAWPGDALAPGSAEDSTKKPDCGRCQC